MNIILLRNIKHFIKDCLGTICFTFFRLFKIKSNRIVFSNYWGLNGYTDSLKYIAEELLKQNSSIQIIWLLKNMNMELPETIIKVKYNTLKAFFYLSTASVWVDSQRKSVFMKKRKGQFYIQTWHGSLGFKQIELDCVNSYDNKKYYLKSRKHDTNMIDLFLSGNYWFNDTIRRAFNYKGEILTEGTPRNDILIKNNDTLLKKKIINSLGLSKYDKIILYAPTFRKDEKDMSPYLSDTKNFISLLNKQLNQNCCLLIRLHPRLFVLANTINYSDNVINVSKYSDIQELLLISDYLITDYSSCIFDFALQYKPGFIYATDLEAFKNDRNFYFNIESSPFPISRNENELINNIVNFDIQNYKKELDKFFKSVNLNETGNSSEKVAKIILKKINN